MPAKVDDVNVKRWIASAVITMVVLVGLLLYVRAMPEYSDAEIHAMQARVEAMRSEHAEEVCERSAFGEARPGTERDFESLFADSATRDCLVRFHDTARETVLMGPRTSTHVWGWRLDRGDASANPPEDNTHEYQLLTDPIPPDDAAPPAVVRECGHLTALVDRLAANPRLCSPLSSGRSSRFEDMGWVIGLGYAVAGLARWRAQRGHRARSFEEALHGIVVVRDLRRGRVSLLVAMISVAAEAIIVGQLASMLMDDPELGAARYARFDRLLETILEDGFDAGVLVSEDPFTVVDIAQGEKALAEALAYAVSFDSSWCPPGARAEDCIDAIHAAPLLDPPSEDLVELLGERLTRGVRLDAAASHARPSFVRYLARLIAADVGLRQLRVLLRLAQRRSETDACPPVLDASWYALDGSDEPMQLSHYNGDVWELIAPPLRSDPSLERRVYKHACPAATVGWFPLPE